MLEFCDFYILFSINSTLMDDLHILDVKTEAQLKRITYFLISLYVVHLYSFTVYYRSCFSGNIDFARA